MTEFILETSRTTGSGKKVIFSEESFLALAETDTLELGLNSRSVISIDRWNIGAWRKIYAARVSGARLVIYPGREKKSMRQWINEEQITYLSILPSTFRWLVSGLYNFPTVQVLELGGEMVDWEDVRLAHECFPSAFFSNRYGTTETNVVTRNKLTYDSPMGEGRLPVGKPIKGVEISIVDGPMGEIKVKSPYAAMGYYNDPELTKAKFREGWYLTGDLGYLLPSGDLMHCGRKDFQGEVRAKFNAELTEGERLSRIANTTIGSL